MELEAPAGQRHGRMGHGLDAVGRGPLEGRRGACRAQGAGPSGWRGWMAAIHVEGHDHVQDGGTTLARPRGIIRHVRDAEVHRRGAVRTNDGVGVEIQSFHLPPEHLHASFAMLGVLTDVEREAMSPQRGTPAGDHQNHQNAGKIPRGRLRPAGTSMPVQEDNTDGEEDEVGDEGDEARVTHRVVTAKVAKMMRKRPGALWWTQKLCRMLDRWLSDEDDEERTVEGLTRQVWDAILDGDKAGKDELKTKIKDKRKK